MKVLESGSGKICFCTGKGNGGNGCGAKLSYTEQDIFYTWRMVPAESHDYFLTIECPECGTLTDIQDCHRKPADYPSHKEWQAGARKAISEVSEQPATTSESDAGVLELSADTSPIVLSIKNDEGLDTVALLIEHLTSHDHIKVVIGETEISGQAYAIAQRLRVYRRKGVTSISVDVTKRRIDEILDYHYAQQAEYFKNAIFQPV